jgi:hypothetical protein
MLLETNIFFVSERDEGEALNHAQLLMNPMCRKSLYV